MYGRRLTATEVEVRIRAYHRPYRDALAEVVEGLWRRHGAVWHFNCHSMKSRGNAMNHDAGVPRPDFVIGDRDGTTAGPGLTEWVRSFFAGRGYAVAVNHPYRGADIVRKLGDPVRRRHSLQIEINRALYLDEATCERGPGFGQVQAELSAFAVAVAAMARQQLAS
jgi:N-formylglutamate deformylase